MTEKTRTITIDPVTRVEGHGKVTVVLDNNNKVVRTRLHIVEFRGFERFIQGRLLWEVPVIVQRLCGICPVSHHLTAAKAMDQIVGAEHLTPAGEKIRRLMHYGQILQSHATHFFYLASPDLLFGFEAQPMIRNIAGVAAQNSQFARHGILLRKFGQEIIEATAGKRIHGTGAVPGGVNQSLSVPRRDRFLSNMHDIHLWASEALSFIKNYTLDRFESIRSFGVYESNYLSLVRDDGAMDLYDGRLKMIDSRGKTVFERVPRGDYREYIAEEVKEWSYMKFPFVKSLGPQDGWYRVGPLARLNICDFMDTDRAERHRREYFDAAGGRPTHLTMLYHWARMIELVHAAEKIEVLLLDPDLQSNDLRAPRSRRRDEAVAVLEAPRGTLFHHYRVGPDDLVKMANLIVSTTQNNEAMNRAVASVVADCIENQPDVTEGMLNKVEAVIRAFDPCLSCATHAIGAMPLAIELRDAPGNLLDRKQRWGAVCS